ncbi:SprT-like domain-containing protein [Halococcus thailandensis]|uniref:SprT-like domain-containing protein n=1 Tax=Halococcus thailandensis TaxID=335952 RepID=UPI0009B5AF53|nr:SprT-like domain-containing protein [Halococcus thailandensis]
MTDYVSLVCEEVIATIDRAGFEHLDADAIRIGVTDSFQRRLGECRAMRLSDSEIGDNQYEVRIARRLFDGTCDAQWRDTVRHEVAHAHVLSTFGQDVQPHGDEWKQAARRAGANPRARYEASDDLVDANYVLTCPDGCYEYGYLQRSKRIKYPWKYACPECEMRLVSYDAGDCPTDLEPGTCYVASLPWETSNDRVSSDASQTRFYLLACPNGCTRWSYQKRGKRVKNPWLYICPECNTTLISCDGGDAPTRFEPGTCNVESIPWSEPQFIHACPNGCFSVGYGQHCEETRHPDQYWCEDCDTPTVSYPTDQRPTDLTPGTNYID